MKCPHCGSYNNNDHIYCIACGKVMTKDANIKPIGDIGSQCPSCGNGTLELRFNGKTGFPFYGCSDYPHCKYVKSIVDNSNATFDKNQKEKQAFMDWLIKPDCGHVKFNTCNSYITALNTFRKEFDCDIYSCTLEELHSLLQKCDKNKEMRVFCGKGHGAFPAALKKYIKFKKFNLSTISKPIQDKNDENQKSNSLFKEIILGIIKEMIDNHEDVVSKKFAHGYTPLMIAAKCNDSEMLKAIIAKLKEAHASLEVQNDMGETAYVVARESKAERAMALLKEAGANRIRRIEKGTINLLTE